MPPRCRKPGKESELRAAQGGFFNKKSKGKKQTVKRKAKIKAKKRKVETKTKIKAKK